MKPIYRWFLIKDGHMVAAAPAINSEEAWVNGVNAYPFSIIQEEQLKKESEGMLFAAKRDWLYKDGWRSKRARIIW